MEDDNAIASGLIYAMEEEIVRSLENGAADYITKPFRLREKLGDAVHIATVRGIGAALPFGWHMGYVIMTYVGKGSLKVFPKNRERKTFKSTLLCFIWHFLDGGAYYLFVSGV